MLEDRQTLASPFSGTEYVFPLASSVTLTLEEASDVWPDFEGVRHELAFRVLGAATSETVYWIPNPSRDGFFIKWREASSNAGHLVLHASVQGAEWTASVSEPGFHAGFILTPYRIAVRRCN
jgi:hypothetical protein